MKTFSTNDSIDNQAHDAKYDAQKASENELQIARLQAEQSMSAFETTMEHLAIKVDETSQTVHHVKEMVAEPKKTIVNATEQYWVNTMVPAFNRGLRNTAQVGTKIRQNPWPVLIGLAAFSAVLLFSRPAKNEAVVRS